MDDVAEDVLEEEYAQWLQEQEEVVHDLREALQRLPGANRWLPDDHKKLAQAVQRAVQNYRSYYQLTENVVSPARKYTFLAGPAVSAVERVFMWMGGQRPSTTFQLLYALMGHQIEMELEELLELDSYTSGAEDGRPPASLASLSALQLTRLNELQTATMKEEDRIEGDLAKLQQSLAGSGLEPVSNKPAADTIISSVQGRGGVINHESSSSSSSANNIIDLNMEEGISSLSMWNQKLVSLQKLCTQADTLRRSTLDRVVELLHTPFQKAQFLLAAAKLQVALRKLNHANTNLTPSTPRS